MINLNNDSQYNAVVEKIHDLMKSRLESGMQEVASLRHDQSIDELADAVMKCLITLVGALSQMILCISQHRVVDIAFMKTMAESVDDLRIPIGILNGRDDEPSNCMDDAILRMITALPGAMGEWGLSLIQGKSINPVEIRSAMNTLQVAFKMVKQLNTILRKGE